MLKLSAGVCTVNLVRQFISPRISNSLSNLVPWCAGPFDSVKSDQFLYLNVERSAGIR